MQEPEVLVVPSLSRLTVRSRVHEDVGLLSRLPGALDSPDSHWSSLDCTWDHSHPHYIRFTPGSTNAARYRLCFLRHRVTQHTVYRAAARSPSTVHFSDNYLILPFQTHSQFLLWCSLLAVYAGKCTRHHFVTWQPGSTEQTMVALWNFLTTQNKVTVSKQPARRGFWIMLMSSLCLRVI